MPSELASIPRSPYAVAMGAASALAVGCGVLAAAGAGGEGATLLAVGAALLVGVALCIVPMLGPPVITPHSWGFVVLGVTGARTFLALGAMLVFLEVQDLPRRPVVYGLLTGTVMMMAAETAVAVWLLSRRERERRPAAPAGGGPAERPGTPRSLA